MDSIFQLDIRHYPATILHPRYRQLRGTSNSEREQCYLYIRQQLKKISRREQVKLRGSLDDCHVQQTIKKMKTSFLERYEDQDRSDEFVELDDELQSMKSPATDELKRYLDLQIDLSSNPLDFWRAHQSSFPQLSKLARRVNSILAKTAAVERLLGLLLTKEELA